MRIETTLLDGVLLISPKTFGDARGFFMETYHQERYRQAGITVTFVQDNLSSSVVGTLRGLHYQVDHPQGKLVQVVQGEIFDVAVDVRQGSPTFGRWVGATLSDENRRQLYVPPGFAHGFCVVSDTALMAYKCTDVYCPTGERSIRWDDPDVGIDWPLDAPILSDKDAAAPVLSALGPDDLFCYEA